MAPCIGNDFVNECHHVAECVRGLASGCVSVYCYMHAHVCGVELSWPVCLRSGPLEALACPMQKPSDDLPPSFMLPLGPSLCRAGRTQTDALPS